MSPRSTILAPGRSYLVACGSIMLLLAGCKGNALEISRSSVPSPGGAQLAAASQQVAASPPAVAKLEKISDLPEFTESKVKWQWDRFPVPYVMVRYAIADKRPEQFDVNNYLGWQMKLQASDAQFQQKLDPSTFLSILRKLEGNIIGSTKVIAALRIQVGTDPSIVTYNGVSNGAPFSGADQPAAAEYIQGRLVVPFKPIVELQKGTVIGADFGRQDNFDSKILLNLKKLVSFVAVPLGPLPAAINGVANAVSVDDARKADKAISEFFSQKGDPQKIGREFSDSSAKTNDIARLEAFDIVLTEERDAYKPDSKIIVRLVFEAVSRQSHFSSGTVDRNGKNFPVYVEDAIRLNVKINSAVSPQIYADLFGGNPDALAQDVYDASTRELFTSMCNKFKRKNRTFDSLPLNKYDRVALPAILMKQAPFVLNPGSDVAAIDEVCFSEPELALLRDLGIEWPLVGGIGSTIRSFVNNFIFDQLYEDFLPADKLVTFFQTVDAFPQEVLPPGFPPGRNSTGMELSQSNLAKLLRTTGRTIVYSKPANGSGACVIGGGSSDLSRPRTIGVPVVIGTTSATLRATFAAGGWVRLEKLGLAPRLANEPVRC